MIKQFEEEVEEEVEEEEEQEEEEPKKRETKKPIPMDEDEGEEVKKDFKKNEEEEEGEKSGIPLIKRIPDDQKVFVGNLSYDTNEDSLRQHLSKSGKVVCVDLFFKSNGQSRGCGIVAFSSSSEASKAIDELNNSSLDGREISVRENRSDRPNDGKRKRDFNNDNSYDRSDNFRRSNRGRFDDNRSGRGDRGRFGGNRGGRGRGSDRGGDRGRFGGNRDGGRFGGNRYNDDNDDDRSFKRRRSNPDLVGKQIYITNLPFDTSKSDLEKSFSQCGEIERVDLKMANGKPKGHATILYKSSNMANSAIEKFDKTDFGGRSIGVKEDRAP